MPAHPSNCQPPLPGITTTTHCPTDRLLPPPQHQHTTHAALQTAHSTTPQHQHMTHSALQTAPPPQHQHTTHSARPPAYLPPNPVPTHPTSCPPIHTLDLAATKLCMADTRDADACRSLNTAFVHVCGAEGICGNQGREGRWPSSADPSSLLVWGCKNWGSCKRVGCKSGDLYECGISEGEKDERGTQGGRGVLHDIWLRVCLQLAGDTAHDDAMLCRTSKKAMCVAPASPCQSTL
eukprot:355020-Chlamydomonas_euryale.AAC.4